jgi:hypothetical protein
MLEFIQIQNLSKIGIFSNSKFVKIIICSKFKFCSNLNFVQISKNLTQNLNFVQTRAPNSIFFKFKICSNFKFVQHLEFGQKSNCVQNSKLFRFQKREMQKKKPGGIPYWAGPCAELHECALLMRANVRCIGPPRRRAGEGEERKKR